MANRTHTLNGQFVFLKKKSISALLHKVQNGSHRAEKKTSFPKFIT
jgi:hypothetical protein